MKKKFSVRLASGLILLIITSSSVWANMVENFEGYTPGNNIAQHPELASFLIPGIENAFTFKSGLVMSRPIPNLGSSFQTFVAGVVLGDWNWNGSVGATGGAPFCFEIDCVASASVLPSGTGYLAYNGYIHNGPVEFILPGAASSVGAYVTAVSDVTLSGYDDAWNLLAVSSISAVDSSNWKYNFLSIENISGITRFSIAGDFFVLDDLVFGSDPLNPRVKPGDNSAPVPEPATMLLFGTGIVGLAAARRRKLASK